MKSISSVRAANTSKPPLPLGGIRLQPTLSGCIVTQTEHIRLQHGFGAE